MGALPLKIGCKHTILKSLSPKILFMKSRKGMNPIMGLIFFMVALVGFGWIATGFLGSMGEASHSFVDELEQIQVNASESYQVVQASNVEHGIQEDSENLSVDGENLEENVNYSVISYETGEFNVTDLSGSGEKTLYLEYRNEVDSKVTGSVNATEGIFDSYTSIYFIFPGLILVAVIMWLL